MELPGVIIASKPQRKTPCLCLIFPMLLFFFYQQLPKETNICLCFFSQKTATTIHVGRYRDSYMRYYSETILENSDVGGCGRNCCVHRLKLWFKKRKQPWTWIWNLGGLTLPENSLTIIHGLLGGLAGVQKTSSPLSWLGSLLHFDISSSSPKTTRWRRVCSAGIPPKHSKQNNVNSLLRVDFSLCLSNGIQVDRYCAFRLSQNSRQQATWAFLWLFIISVAYTPVASTKSPRYYLICNRTQRWNSDVKFGMQLSQRIGTKSDTCWHYDQMGEKAIETCIAMYEKWKKTKDVSL